MLFLIQCYIQPHHKKTWRFQILELQMFRCNISATCSIKNCALIHVYIYEECINDIDHAVMLLNIISDAHPLSSFFFVLGPLWPETGIFLVGHILFSRELKAISCLLPQQSVNPASSGDAARHSATMLLLVQAMVWCLGGWCNVNKDS